MYDVIVIGAGVSGSAIARELSRYDIKICVIEKESDVCEGTSKANSGIVHAGHDARPGTLKARLNVMGNGMMDELSKKLDFPFIRNGSMVVCWSEDEVQKLEELKERGEKNGVPGIEILSREEALKLEPNLADGVYAVLHVPTGGIVCPFLMNIAFAENAAVNGAEFKLSEKVTGISKKDSGYRVTTDKGEYETKVVINAAGVYADTLHNMVSAEKRNIIPRRGEYMLLDKTAGRHISHTIFQLPSKMGKGILVTPTTHGNLLVGPTADNLEDKEALCTTREGLAKVAADSARSVKDIPLKTVITSFAGLRAHEPGGDFIIEEVKDAPGFVDVLGIASPGLSSAPAVGVYVKDIVTGILDMKQKDDFIDERKGTPRFMELSDSEKEELISRDPSYGQIICRCEMITEGEILDAIRRPLGAKTLDGIKRRVRAGMGRCQAGFCTPRLIEILERETGQSIYEIKKNQAGSELIVGEIKDAW